jgi:hypothetical protein
MKPHGSQVQQLTPEAMLEQDDRKLAVSVLMAMAVAPEPENFAALGKLIRAGVAAEDGRIPNMGTLGLERVLLRRRR